MPIARRAAERGKAIVVAKVGRSAAFQLAAISHTGHLTGPSALYSALFARCGIVEVDTLEELLDVAAMLSRWPSARNPVDMTAGGKIGAAIASVVEQVCTSEVIDMVVLVDSPMAQGRSLDRARALGEVARNGAKPVAVFAYTHPEAAGVAALAEARVPWFVSQSGLARAMTALADRGDFLRRRSTDLERAASTDQPDGVDRSAS